MRKSFLLLTAVMLFTWQIPSFADSSVDELIQKLQDKGILTSNEADQLKGDAQASEQNNAQTTFKTMLPDWINSIKLTGDFRLRDQYQRIDVAKGSESTKAGYNRGRLRARLNVEDQITDQVKVIFGIATEGENSAGQWNPRSNNLTFGGNASGESPFAKTPIVLNRAYAIYTPNSNITLMGGKMDNPIWEPISGNAQLLWDPNITPEGGAVQLQKKINDYITPFSTNTMFVLADQSPTVGSTTAPRTDPYIFVTQDGVKGNLNEKVYYKAAFSYYDVSNPSRIALSNRPSSVSSGTNNTNSTNSTGTQYTYNYYLAGGSVELGMNDPFGEMLPDPIYIPQIGIIGQYFQNVDIDHNNGAWEFGAYMGSSQLNGWGTWKLTSVFKVLERDSWLDTMPDQDDYNGATDTEAWRNEIDIGLAKNIWCAFTYYHANVYKYFSTLSTGSTAYSGSAPENMYQMDLNFKF